MNLANDERIEWLNYLIQQETDPSKFVVLTDQLLKLLRQMRKLRGGEPSEGDHGSP